MNKTEVLVALLEKARQWERPDGTPQVDPQSVAEEMGDALSRLQAADEAADELAQLLIIGGAVVYLLTDEVQPVAGRELDEWLADKVMPSRTTSAGMEFSGLSDQVLHVITGGAVGEPTHVNGQIGREL